MEYQKQNLRGFITAHFRVFKTRRVIPHSTLQDERDQQCYPATFNKPKESHTLFTVLRGLIHQKVAIAVKYNMQAAEERLKTENPLKTSREEGQCHMTQDT